MKKYNNILNIKISDEMKVKLQDVSQKEDKTISDYVRNLIYKNLRKEGKG